MFAEVFRLLGDIVARLQGPEAELADLSERVEAALAWMRSTTVVDEEADEGRQSWVQDLQLLQKQLKRVPHACPAYRTRVRKSTERLQRLL